MFVKPPAVCPECAATRFRETKEHECFNERLNADPTSPELRYEVTNTTFHCTRCAYQKDESDMLKERDRARQKFWLAEIKRCVYGMDAADVDKVRTMLNKFRDEGRYKIEWLFDWLINGERVV